MLYYYGKRVENLSVGSTVSALLWQARVQDYAHKTDNSKAFLFTGDPSML